MTILDARTSQGWDKDIEHEHAEHSLFMSIMDIRKNARAIAGDPLLLIYLRRDRDILNSTVAEIEQMNAMKEAV